MSTDIQPDVFLTAYRRLLDLIPEEALETLCVSPFELPGGERLVPVPVLEVLAVLRDVSIAGWTEEQRRQAAAASTVKHYGALQRSLGRAEATARCREVAQPYELAEGLGEAEASALEQLARHMVARSWYPFEMRLIAAPDGDGPPHLVVLCEHFRGVAAECRPALRGQLEPLFASVSWMSRAEALHPCSALAGRALDSGSLRACWA
jgi:hypothetical protein